MSFPVPCVNLYEFGYLPRFEALHDGSWKLPSPSELQEKAEGWPWLSKALLWPMEGWRVGLEK